MLREGSLGLIYVRIITIVRIYNFYDVINLKYFTESIFDLSVLAIGYTLNGTLS